MSRTPESIDRCEILRVGTVLQALRACYVGTQTTRSLLYNRPNNLGPQCSKRSSIITGRGTRRRMRHAYACVVSSGSGSVPRGLCGLHTHHSLGAAAPPPSRTAGLRARSRRRGLQLSIFGAYGGRACARCTGRLGAPDRGQHNSGLGRWARQLAHERPS